ncbi:sigma-70 family RNA polymerase sigma factor [Candidatus Aminicenantes bacterium AC-334-K16]|nr:sigma-70 family RNA polymerase sigma factor [Candidatus Aminicenantes bacterium AC-334-K16]
MTGSTLDLEREKELLQRARDGDEEAFREIVSSHQRQVAATVMGMLGNCPEAEDVGQEVFIQFFRSLHRFRGEARIATYLTRIALNLAVNELRRRKKEKQMLAAGAEGLFMSSTTSLEEKKDSRRLLQQALQQLDSRFREVIVLRFLNGYSSEETARILKLPLGTVLSRLARAQMKLREILLPLMGKEP